MNLFIARKSTEMDIWSQFIESKKSSVICKGRKYHHHH